MTHATETTSETHTYACALPTRGGVCDCQPGHDPSIDPWPQTCDERSDEEADVSPSPASRFRPGGRHRMFISSLSSDLVGEQQPAA